MNNELIVPSKETALTVYQTQNGLDPFLEHIRKEIDAFVPDVATKKGRDEIASIAYKVAKSKTALDDLGKEIVNDLKELPKKIDAERKRVREILDAWKEEVRKPLTEWEQAEESRKAYHKNSIENIKTATHEIELIDSALLKSRIVAIESVVIDASFEEFELEAVHTKEGVLNKLKYALEKREQYETEQAELARLRAEAAAREQKEREERIAKEARESAIKASEEKAKLEREASERRELELKLQAEKAEREKLEAIRREELAIKDASERAERIAKEAEERALKQAEEKAKLEREASERAERLKIEAEERQKAAIEAEKKRQADEIAAAEAERLKREQNIAHMKKINNEALKSFIDNGLTEDCAKLAISLIAKKLINNITINY